MINCIVDKDAITHIIDVKSTLRYWTFCEDNLNKNSHIIFSINDLIPNLCDKCVRQYKIYCLEENISKFARNKIGNHFNILKNFFEQEINYIEIDYKNKYVNKRKNVFFETTKKRRK